MVPPAPRGFRLFVSVRVCGGGGVEQVREAERAQTYGRSRCSRGP